jgi:hypothetical protein
MQARVQGRQFTTPRIPCSQMVTGFFISLSEELNFPSPLRRNGFYNGFALLSREQF